MTDPNPAERPRERRPDGRVADEVVADLARGRDDVRRQGEAQAERAKEHAAAKADAAAAGLHAAASEVAERDDLLEHGLRQAGQSLADLADRLHGRSIAAIVDDVETFGRRNPALFMGMAVAVGIGLGRLARARTPETDAAAAARPAAGGAR